MKPISMLMLANLPLPGETWRIFSNLLREFRRCEGLTERDLNEAQAGSLCHMIRNLESRELRFAPRAVPHSAPKSGTGLLPCGRGWVLVNQRLVESFAGRAQDGGEFVARFFSINGRELREDLTMAREVIATLNALIAEKSLLQHPFYQAWSAGELPIERLREYAIRYYPQVAAFPRYLSAIHSRCADVGTRQALLENLIEEERGADNHPELWLRFAEALGVTRERVVAPRVSPAIENTIATFAELCAENTVSGLAAIYAYEAQIPAVASAKIDGLKRFYGIDEERGVAFFRVHEHADVWHAQTDAQLIEKHCVSDTDAAVAINAGRRTLDALWSALDSM